MKRKPTHDEKLLIALYQEMKKKDPNVTVSEVLDETPIEGKDENPPEDEL
jgi:hypothetical protein